MTLKTLYLIRHGEAGHLVSDLTGGWSDTALTELGQEQARRAGIRLAGLLAGREYQFYASDQTRTRQTAERISESLGRPAVLTPTLRELNNGIAANRTRTEAKRLRNPLTQPVLDWVPYPGGESWREFLKRLLPFFEEAAAGPFETALWVSHGNVLQAAVDWWLGLNDAQMAATHFEFDPASLTHLGYTGWGGRAVYKLNDTAHLEAWNG